MSQIQSYSHNPRPILIFWIIFFCIHIFQCQRMDEKNFEKSEQIAGYVNYTVDISIKYDEIKSIYRFIQALYGLYWVHIGFRLSSVKFNRLPVSRRPNSLHVTFMFTWFNIENMLLQYRYHQYCIERIPKSYMIYVRLSIF